jgi:hypothetical protein
VKLGFTFKYHELTHRQASGDPGRMPRDTIHDGKQLTAARALAGLGIRELANAAGIAPRTLHRLEVGGVIHVSEKKRHGHVQRAVWERIMAALATAGVELLSEAGSFGAGVRWKKPRERRSPDSTR